MSGATLTYQPTPEMVPTDQHAAMRELVSDMNAGRVQVLLIVGEANPVQTAPADLRFADAISKVQTRFHSGLFLDETATLCHWHVPAAHYLEAWSDARTVDGTVSIVQPLIQPLYGGKSAHEVVATLSDRPERLGYDLVREYWTQQAQGMLQAGAASAAGAAGAAGAQMRESAAAAPRSPVLPPVTGNVSCTSPGHSSTPAADARTTGRGHVRKNWRRWLHDGFIAGTAFASAPAHRCRTGRTSAPAAPAAPVAPIPGVRAELPARPHDLRRPFRQQWLVAGASQTGHEADLGQCRAHLAGHRRAARSRERRHHSGHARRPPAATPDLDESWTRRRRHHDSPWLRSYPRGPRRQRHRFQRLCAARQRVTVVWCRRDLPNRRPLRPRAALRTTGQSKAATSCARPRSTSSRRSRRLPKRWST